MSIELDLSPLQGRRALCAVSGGADSMCLLYLLHGAGLDIAAAHYEHGIRGAEALRDAEFVEEQCEKLGVRCVIGHGDVPTYAREHGLGTEEAARILRYEFLERAADELGCELIATAHNLDDNAETMLLNLCRGAGSAGLRGIPSSRGRLVRPLLNTPRMEIELYLAERGIEHIEDGTNALDDCSRNLIRHRVMPVLRGINPRASAAMGRSARLIARDDDCLNAMAEDFIEKYFDGESLPLAELCALHRAVSSRVVRMLAKRSLSMEQVEKALDMAESSELSYIDLPGQTLRFERGRLWLNAENAGGIAERVLTPGERLLIPEAGLAVSAEFVIYSKEINDLFKTYFFKCENINGNVLVTGRRPGDRLRPIGRGCGKSLKSLFLEAGYTQRQRELTPVFRDGDGVLAVYGLAADERTRPRRGDTALRIQIEAL